MTILVIKLCCIGIKMDFFYFYLLLYPMQDISICDIFVFVEFFPQCVPTKFQSERDR